MYISFCKSSFFKKYRGIFRQYYICVNIISLPLELKAYTEAALFHCAPSRFHFNYLLDGFLIFTLIINLKFLYNSNEKCKLLVGVTRGRDTSSRRRRKRFLALFWRKVTRSVFLAQSNSRVESLSENRFRSLKTCKNECYVLSGMWKVISIWNSSFWDIIFNFKMLKNNHRTCEESIIFSSNSLELLQNILKWHAASSELFSSIV